MVNFARTATWFNEGHRGTRGQALTVPGPGLLAENSVPAFLYIFRQGIKSCELDIHLVEDVPYVYHDDHLNDGTDLEYLLYAFLDNDPDGVRKLISSITDLKNVYGEDLSDLRSLIDADGILLHEMPIEQKAALCALYTTQHHDYLADIRTVTGGTADLRRLAILAAQDPAREGKVYIGDCTKAEIEGLRLMSNPYPDDRGSTDVQMLRKPLDVAIPSFARLLQELDAAKAIEPTLDPRLNIELKMLTEVYDRDPVTLAVKKDAQEELKRIAKDPALIVHQVIVNFLNGSDGYKPLADWDKDKNFIFSSFSADVLARIDRVSDIKYSALFAARQPRDWRRTANGDLYYREFKRAAVGGKRARFIEAHQSGEWTFARKESISDRLFNFTPANVIQLLDDVDNDDDFDEGLNVRAKHERIWDLTEEEFIDELDTRIQPPPIGLGLKPKSINIPIPMLTPKVIATINAIPAEICVWTANEPNPLHRPRQEVFDLLTLLDNAGVATFITDHAEAYVRLIQEYIAHKQKNP